MAAYLFYSAIVKFFCGFLTLFSDISNGDNVADITFAECGRPLAKHPTIRVVGIAIASDFGIT